MGVCKISRLSVNQRRRERREHSERRDRRKRPLLPTQFFPEAFQVTGESGHQLATDNQSVVIDEIQVCYRLSPVIRIASRQKERIRFQQMVMLRDVGIIGDDSPQEGLYILVESLTLIVQPFFDDAPG